jgi:nascent polypeptide-associated complex subunit alpha
MFPKIDPKKMQAMMKQMGISQNEIDASRVIIEKTDGSKIIITEPNVVKVNMSGQESFQITGKISEDDEENQEEQDEDTKQKEDIKTIMEQTGVSEDIAAIEFEKNDFDLAETIISLSKKKK